MATILERVSKILVDLLGVSDQQIQPTTSFAELDIDSLDLVEFVIQLEDEFAGEDDSGAPHFEITDEQAKHITTVRDVVDYLRSRGVKD
jgi:acyl carrier protein